MAHQVDFLVVYDRESILAELRRVAEMLGKNFLTTEDIERYARVSPSTVIHRFGSLHRAQLDAGLVPTFGRGWTKDELLKILSGVWGLTQKNLGRRPRMADFERYRIPVRATTVARRFGSWKKALLAASEVPDAGLVAEPREVAPARAPISVRKRFQVFQRDMYRCCICQRSGVRLELDHIVPVSLGGSDKVENLQTLCWDCNRGKRNNMQ
jgi:hypothetical protein